MPVIYHLGDSISMGQESRLSTIYGADYSRHNFNGDKNGMSSKSHITDDWINGVPANCDLLIQNCGLWDLQRNNGYSNGCRTSLQEYEYNLERIVSIYRNLTTHYIWCSTTVFSSTNSHLMYLGDWIGYQGVEEKVMKRNKVEYFIYSGFTLSADGVHPVTGSQGYDRMADEISVRINQILGI